MPSRDDDRRRQILDAAQHVFAQKGFRGASIKDLAGAANVSPGLLYWYFRDKTDLFISLLAERIAEGFGSLADHISVEMPPAQFLPAFGSFYLGLFEIPANAALFRMVITDAQSLPAVGHQVRAQLVGRVIGTLQDYFQRQIEAGQMRACDTEMVARTYMGGIMGYLLLRYVLRDERASALPAEALAAGISDVVLRGILPVAASPDGALSAGDDADRGRR